MPVDQESQVDQGAEQPEIIRRHPSAGNLNVVPRVVSVEEPPDALPSLSFPHGDQGLNNTVSFGPGVQDRSLLKMLGTLAGSRVLDLGCGVGGAAIPIAREGARVTAVEPSTSRLARAREAAELAEVHVEFHHSDLADLPYVRADSIDAAISIYSLSQVQDLPRVFRQIHRVLSPNAPFVISLPHPGTSMLEWDIEADSDTAAEGAARAQSAAWDREAAPSSPWLWRHFWADQPIAWRVGGDEGTTHLHQISDVFTALVRSNFRVDTLLEPQPDANSQSLHTDAVHEWMPPTLIIRGRKVGN